MSENSDAVVIVVSEETGVISIAVEGVLYRGYTRETLASELKKYMVPETYPSQGKIKKIYKVKTLLKGDKSSSGKEKKDN